MTTTAGATARIGHAEGKAAYREPIRCGSNRGFMRGGSEHSSPAGSAIALYAARARRALGKRWRKRGSFSAAMRTRKSTPSSWSVRSKISACS